MEAILDAIESGERLSVSQARRLFDCCDLDLLGALADQQRQRVKADDVVTYVIGRNINYSNVCWVKCKFCNFYAAPGDAGGYVLSHDRIFRKIEELVELGGTEVLMQGGLNPRLRLEYFEELLSQIKARFDVHLHSLSAPEIIYIAHLSRLSLEECIRRLRDAGLDSIPGAGAEILVDEVRDVLAFRKDRTEEWLEVHRTAHRLGMNTTATMMYGSVETLDHRVEHLARVRELQDEALSRPAGGGRFTAFIPWSFQPQGVELTRDGTFAGQPASAFDYLRTLAVSRLFLDNVENFQASWVTQGPRVAQISLRFGVNDFGSSMMEENVVSAAGTRFAMPIPEMERLIRAAGYRPLRRNTGYEILGEFDDLPESCRAAIARTDLVNLPEVA